MTPYQVAHTEPESSPSHPWRPRIVHEQAPVALAARAEFPAFARTRGEAW